MVTLHHSRILFRALPNAWVVHRPHTLNPAAGIAKNRTGSTTSLTGVGSLSEVGALRTGVLEAVAVMGAGTGTRL